MTAFESVTPSLSGGLPRYVDIFIIIIIAALLLFSKKNKDKKKNNNNNTKQHDDFCYLGTTGQTVPCRTLVQNANFPTIQCYFFAVFTC